jgi:MFS family permease
VNRAVSTVWIAWLVLMAGANLATPLYAVYAQEFGFSSLVLTSIFATYAFVLVPALILFGRLSDRFGRRPVLFGGLSVAAAALVVFAAADGAAWLYAARGLQRLAVGMISGAATAALVELDPARDRRRAASARAVLPGHARPDGAGRRCDADRVRAGGRRARSVARRVAACACGDSPRLREGEPDGRHGLGKRRALPLDCPVLRARPACDVESRAARLDRLGDAAGFLRLPDRRATLRRQASPDQAGLALLALGLGGLVLAGPLKSLACLLLGAVAAGAGHGLAFLNAQQELNDLAPSDRRGEVTSAFISCIYFLVATAVIATGLLDLSISLTAAVETVASALFALAIAIALWQLGGLKSPPMPAKSASAAMAGIKTSRSKSSWRA